MNDYNTTERQRWIEQELQKLEHDRPDDSPWWWAVAIVYVIIFFMLVAYVGPVVFPEG